VSSWAIGFKYRSLLGEPLLLFPTDQSAETHFQTCFDLVWSKLMILSNKCAIIYGGSGAIGSAVGHSFAREGATIHLAAQSIDRLEETAAAMRAKGASVSTSQVDVLEPAAVEAHAQSVAQSRGGIDIVMNAVSFMHNQGALIDELDVDAFIAPVNMFLRANFNTAKAVMPHLKPGAVILTLSTPAAKMTVPGHLGYAATCAAIEAFSRNLAQEVGHRGIRVVCLRPHAISDAPANGSYTAKLFEPKARAAGLSVDAWLQMGAAGTPLGRLPTLADVAEAATFIASSRASAMTAAILNLSCGQIAD
jgi:3-oxoacyl-[acyl-carrier protein] reductase